MTSHKLRPQIHCLKEGLLLLPHTLKKSLRPTGKWSRGVDTITAHKLSVPHVIIWQMLHGYNFGDASEGFC